jgi:hypothetical protein
VIALGLSLDARGADGGYMLLVGHCSGAALSKQKTSFNEARAASQSAIRPDGDGMMGTATQLPALRATALANIGPSNITRMNRAICMAMTNGTSTLFEEAAMIATESAPPGLVAR